MSKTSKGFAWSAIDYFSVQAIQFIISIIIARLVSPSAYGVIVMVQVFMGFAQIFIESGFKDALIQKKDRRDIDFYTVFIFNIVVAVALYVLIFIASPLIADFYNEPMLIPLTRVIALNLIISSISIIQLVRLQINLDFKTQAKARIISVILSGIIGIVCAYNGMEVWALVIQGILSSFITTVMLMFFSRWYPRLQFSVESFKCLFAYGSKMLFGNFLTTCYIQITNLIIGKVYTPAQLAYYNRAFSISQLPSASLTGIISRTTFPILCQLQDDEEKLMDSYKKYVRLSCLIIFPILAFVCVFAKPLIMVVLTERWVEMAPLLSIFCMVFVPYPIFVICNQVVLAKGYAGLMTQAVVVKRTIGFPLLVITLPISVMAVALGLVVGNIMEMLISMYCLQKVSEQSICQQLSMFWDIVLITVLASLVAWLCSSFFDIHIIKLIVAFAINCISYILCIYFFRLKERFVINKIIEKTIKNNE